MKKNFYKIIFLFAILLLSLQGFAQDNDNNRRGNRPGTFDREAFVAKRNAFIAEKIGLATEVAAVFFPVENELIIKKFEAGRDCRRLEHEIRGKKDKSDAEYQKLLDCREEVKAKTDKLDKEYLEKFKKILTAEQIIKYQGADREFFDQMMRERKR